MQRKTSGTVQAFSLLHPSINQESGINEIKNRQAFPTHPIHTSRINTKMPLFGAASMQSPPRDPCHVQFILKTMAMNLDILKHFPNDFD